MKLTLNLNCHSTMFLRAAVVLIALTCSSLAFCGEIHEAAKSGDLAKVKAMLKDNPSLISSRENDYGATPLHCAVDKLRYAVVEFLLKNNADIDVKDNDGFTALFYAARSGDTNIVQLLLSNKANVNTKGDGGMSPLHCAAYNDFADVAQLLLAGKADVNIRDNNGATPLLEAAVQGNRKVAEVLLANKADVNAANKYGATPLFAASGKSRDLLELLLRNNADVHLKVKGGQTPLHLAAEFGNTDTAELLLQKGVDVNAKDNDGATPLSLAATNGHRAMVRILLAHKALDAKVSSSSTATVSQMLLDKTYGEVTEQDGIQFQADLDSIEVQNSIFGGSPAGTLKKFGVLDSGGKFFELALEDHTFKDGEIKTKVLGIVRAKYSGSTTLSYAITGDQLKKAHTFIAEQK